MSAKLRIVSPTPPRATRRPPMYRADLPLAWVRAAANGICTEGLARWAHGALKWHRDAIRATTVPHPPTKRRRRR
jgi:hypothetical protein